MNLVSLHPALVVGRKIVVTSQACWGIRGTSPTDHKAQSLFSSHQPSLQKSSQTCVHRGLTGVHVLEVLAPEISIQYCIQDSPRSILSVPRPLTTSVWGNSHFLCQRVREVCGQTPRSSLAWERHGASWSCLCGSLAVYCPLVTFTCPQAPALFPLLQGGL